MAIDKKITFIPQFDRLDVTLPVPKPAINYMPDWWIKGEQWVNADSPEIANYSSNAGMKRCLAFMDSFHMGYMLETWTDIQIKIDSDSPKDYSITWLTSPDPLKSRDINQGRTIPRPTGHIDDPFVWASQWGIKTASGYSVLVTHPFNRFDLPFTTLTGVIDSDSAISAGNLPFFIKEGWSGIIPAGTPYAQIIPFKRDTWASTLGSKKDVEEARQLSFDTRRTLIGWYKNKGWNKKVFK